MIARLHARLNGFQARVSRALSLVEQAAELGAVGVSFSGGKDSTVVLDLVRRVIPNAPAAFFDSGAELRQTYDIIAHYGAETIRPEMDLIELCKYGGYWGYEHPADPDVTFDFGKLIIDAPARAFIEKHELDVVGIGLRAQESAVRAFNARQKGTLYFCQYDHVYHLCPLQQWSTMDVWAYIYSRDLAYNAAYDVMDRLGIPEERQRIGPVLGASVANFGRYVYLKQVDPELWNRLAAIFPAIRRYT